VYFECLYVDATAKDIKAHTVSDDTLQQVGGNG
jgi:hypothetical protein